MKQRFIYNVTYTKGGLGKLKGTVYAENCTEARLSAKRDFNCSVILKIEKEKI